MLGLGVALLSFAAVVQAAPVPTNQPQLECALHQVALTMGVANVNSSHASLYDALNLEQLCAGLETNPELSTALANARRAFLSGSWPTPAPLPVPTNPKYSFYVAVAGNDGNPGSQAQPFATLARAQEAMRGIPASARQTGGAAVWVGGGTYQLNATLLLTEQDSFVTWAALPGQSVVLTGSTTVSASWKPTVPGGSILVADVTLPDARRDAWVAGGRKGAAPPAAVNQLFVDGARMVRARYPNGNPQTSDGLCFSKAQRPGEGCSAWAHCVVSDNGVQPAPQPVYSAGSHPLTPNRGNSPTLGCATGCAQYYGEEAEA